jgi:hypothetical protein
VSAPLAMAIGVWIGMTMMILVLVILPVPRSFVGSADVAPGGGSTEAVAAIAAPQSASDAISYPAPLLLIGLGDQSAADAFHALHNAAQILRGDDVTDEEVHRASTLIHEATVDVATLYQKLIRAQRGTHSLRSGAAGA